MLGETVTIARQLERAYWSMAVLVGLVLVGASPWIAGSWLKSDSPVSLAAPLAYACVGIAANLPIGFYAAGLIALQRQVLVNTLYVSSNILKFGGSVVVAAATDGSLRSFFLWMVAASGISVAAYAIALRSCLPRTSPSRLTSEARAAMWRFTFGVSAVSVGLLLLSQSDKILVSRFVGVEQFAYYSLAGTVIGGLSLLYQPVVSTFAPKLAQSYGSQDLQRLSALYHASNQVLAATVFPAAVVIAMFSSEVVFLWTRSARITAETGPLVMALMPGAMAGAAVYMPYSLLRAAGWTAMPSKVLFSTLIVLVPVLSLVVTQWGAVGAAMTWSAVVVLQAAVIVFLMHRRLLTGELTTWLTADVGAPLCASLITCFTLRVLFPTQASPLAMFEVLLVTSLLTLAAAVLSTEATRAQAQNIFIAMRALLRGEPVES
jgi:O-antigen/teichoic acid export membrane protein